MRDDDSPDDVARFYLNVLDPHSPRTREFLIDCDYHEPAFADAVIARMRDLEREAVLSAIRDVERST